jgi:hypothetical protein
MRTGGQVVGPVVVGSVEYGPMTSGTPLVVVLGHQRCGAVKAAYGALKDDKPLPGNLQSIAEALRPAYRETVKTARRPGRVRSRGRRGRGCGRARHGLARAGGVLRRAGGEQRRAGSRPHP